MMLLAALVTGVTVLFVLSPLLGWGAAPAFGTERRGDQQEELLRQRQEILGSIKDLEMEFAVGKLTREDYEASRNALSREAVELYRILDRDDES